MAERDCSSESPRAELITASTLLVDPRDDSRRVQGAPVAKILMDGHGVRSAIGWKWMALSAIAATLLALSAALVDSSPRDIAIDCALASGLLALSLIDIRTGRLPNILTAPLGFAGLLVANFAEDRLLESAVGAILGYSALSAFDSIYAHIRGRHGLGGGDAKLLAAGGAWLGWEAMPQVVLIASIVGLTIFGFLSWRGRQIALTSPLPFGPALALGIWCARLSRHFSM